MEGKFWKFNGLWKFKFEFLNIFFDIIKIFIIVTSSSGIVIVDISHFSIKCNLKQRSIVCLFRLSSKKYVHIPNEVIENFRQKKSTPKFFSFHLIVGMKISLK